MTIEIVEEEIARLPDHASIRSAFTVERVLEVEMLDGGLRGIALTERVLEAPYEKDYDATQEGGPAQWPVIFDVSNWGWLGARSGTQRVGGAVIAFNTPGIHMLGERSDLAVLWDIRVRPELRRHGIGGRLFGAVERWASARRCRWLKIETQNINVPACRFYARRGCVLGAIHRFAYPDLPGETILLWYRDLSAERCLHS